MLNNYLGNKSYFLINNFNLKEKDIDETLFKFQIEEEYVIKKFIKFLDKECGEKFNEKEFRRFFNPHPFQTEQDYEIYAIDEENILFIDGEYYFSYIAQGEDRLIYLTCESVLGSSDISFRF